MITKGSKTVKELIEERIKNEEDVLATIILQIIVPQKNGKNFFYTTETFELKKSKWELSIKRDGHIGTLYSYCESLLKNLNREIGNNKMLFVKNNNGKDCKLIRTDDISEVQILIS